MTKRRPPRPAARRPEPPRPAAEPDDEPYEDDVEYDAEEDFEDGPEPLDCVDADAFFAAEISDVRPAVLTLYGHDYVLPTSTPLSFSLLAERHASDESLASIRTVLTPVFGSDALDFWLDQGIDQRRFGIVLMFAAQNMEKPGSATLAECARRYDEQAARGKALNRAARRASGARSSNAGRS